MPAHRPIYPPLPSHYRDVEVLIVYYRAAPAAIREFLPEPLEPAPSGIVSAWALRMPFCSAYGPFHESCLSMAALFRGKPVVFDSHVYLDNVSAICSGRERWGAPKEYAEVTFERQGALIHSQTVQAGTTIMSLTAHILQPARPEDVPDLGPSVRLKLIPRADGPGAAVKQLIRAVDQDMQCAHLMAGDGMVRLGRTSHCDLAGLQPLEILGAYYQVITFTETYGVVEFDYLTDAWPMAEEQGR